jgi:hypothetical protein
VSSSQHSADLPQCGVALAHRIAKSGVVPREGAEKRVTAVRTNLTYTQGRRGADSLSPANSDVPQVIGAHADFRREDYMFQRTQSLAMRALEWENRMKPMRHWAPNFVANLAFEIFA